MKAKRILILVLALSLLLVGSAGSAVPNTVDWWVIAAGGGPGTGSDHVTLDATLGQPVIGPSAGPHVMLGDGYWHEVPEPPAPAYHIYLPVVLREAP